MEDFERVASFLRQHMDKFTDDQKLFMYGLYKQATKGDIESNYKCNDIVSKCKFDAWVKNKGMDKEEAMDKYVKIGSKFERKLLKL